ncbi:MAG: DMT family protein [Bacteroidaceae bacterium]|nr:DMT family protein [Bacteroidaceae bacterium]
MKGFYTVLLLIGSNIFMTLAWYGHLKLSQMKISTSWPLFGIILFMIIRNSPCRYIICAQT